VKTFCVLKFAILKAIWITPPLSILLHSHRLPSRQNCKARANQQQYRAIYN